MEDYGQFYAKSDRRVARPGHFARRKHGGLPYKIDRDGDAQMGEGSGAVSSVSVNAPQVIAGGRGRGRGQHIPRARSVAQIGEKPSVFARLGRASQELYQRGRGGRARAPHHNRPQTVTWYKVKIPGSAQVDRVWLVKTLEDNLSVPLNPIQIAVDGNALAFYINNSTASHELKNLHRILSFPHGGKMGIWVNQSQAPVMHLDDAVKEKIKQAMSSRYDIANQSLNLSSFAEDTLFKAESLSIQLTRPNVMNCVVDLIQTNIQDLRVLDLSKNKLTQLCEFATLCGKIFLRQLILSDNFIPRMHEIARLRGFTSLEDLNISRNPLRDEFRDTSLYVESVRKRLPNLLQLDGVELPRKIGFEAPVQVTLPAPVPFHVPSEDAKKELMTFVQQFFSCFDNQRASLVGAYSEDAQFSLEASRYSDKSVNQHSRNLVQIQDNSKRTRNLFVGKSAIMNLFLTLPTTQHIMESFTMDVYYNEHSSIGFGVAGLLREDFSVTPYKKGFLRSFSRNFIVKIVDHGLNILSDMLSTTIASSEQTKQFSNVAVPSSVVIPPSPVAPVVDEATKAAMVAAFAAESGMNEHFSRMALQDNSWDYPKAGAAFLQLRADNQIPNEAYIK